MHYLGVTGTPGTGKKTIAAKVSATLGVRAYGLTDLASRYGLLGGEGEVDAAELGRRIRSGIKGRSLLFGHLLPYAFSSRDMVRVVVLRCDPAILGRRLASRGYPRSQLRENVEAELIGLVSADSASRFGPEKVFEFDTTASSPDAASAAVADLLSSGQRGRPCIDWTRDYDSPEKLRSLLGERKLASALT